MINTISITHVIVYATCTRLKKLIVIYLNRPLTNVLKEGQTIFPSIPKEIPLRVLVPALVSHPRSSTIPSIMLKTQRVDIITLAFRQHVIQT